MKPMAGTLLRRWMPALACLALAVGASSVLTRLMSLHMLVQIPLLVLSGVFAEMAFARSCNKPATNAAAPAVGMRRGWSWNEYGLPGLIFASLLGAVWMVPKALDDALVDWRMAAFKYAGLPVCGWILSASLRKAPLVIKIFFLGNFCWMSAIVGLLYMDQPTRLCNAYLQDDQLWAGRGLVALAVGLPLAWVFFKFDTVWKWLKR